jgi:hypothetical protein
MSRIMILMLYYIARYFYIVGYSVTLSGFLDFFFFLYKIEGIGHTEMRKKRIQVTTNILRQKRQLK